MIGVKIMIVLSKRNMFGYCDTMLFYKTMSIYAQFCQEIIKKERLPCLVCRQFAFAFSLRDVDTSCQEDL